MKIRLLLLAALLVLGAAACHSATEPEPSTRSRGSETVGGDSTRIGGGFGMGSGN